MSITVRKAVLADVSKILDILNYEILHTTAVYEYEPKTLAQQEAWFLERQAAGFPVLVAELDDLGVVGYGSYGPFRPRIGYRFSVEHSVYLAQEAQGKGIGRLLMQALIEEAKAAGLHTFIAGIDAENLGSIEFHKKFGFVEVARIKEVAYKFDRWLDLVFMQLILD